MDTNVLFWISGGVVGLAGLGLWWWALFADRSRGRRRCPKCWYDMSKTAGLRCPECGREAKREQSLQRTRRKWKWAFASLLVLLGAMFLALQPKVRENGWASVMPATLLILALDMSDPQWALDEIHSASRSMFRSWGASNWIRCDGRERAVPLAVANDRSSLHPDP